MTGPESVPRPPGDRGARCRRRRRSGPLKLHAQGSWHVTACRYWLTDHLNRHSEQWQSHVGSAAVSVLLNAVPISALPHCGHESCSG